MIFTCYNLADWFCLPGRSNSWFFYRLDIERCLHCLLWWPIQCNQQSDSEKCFSWPFLQVASNVPSACRKRWLQPSNIFQNEDVSGSTILIGLHLKTYGFDFPFLNDGVAGVIIVTIWTLNGSIVTKFNDVSQTIPFESLEDFDWFNFFQNFKSSLEMEPAKVVKTFT